MWRRTYLFLLLLRVYFALSPSYLHPDENFQGPEVFAGKPAMRFLCDRDLYTFATRLAFILWRSQVARATTARGLPRIANVANVAPSSLLTDS
jgi:hypothetical protein